MGTKDVATTDVVAMDEQAALRRKAAIGWGPSAVAPSPRGATETHRDPITALCPGETSARIQRIMQATSTTVFVGVITIWALIGEDIKLMAMSADADRGMEIVSATLFVIFMAELVINSLTQPNYFLNFFWWLDLVAAVSMLLDIEAIRNAVFEQGTADLTVARAGRAAKAGTRAGRLLKMTRLLRVIKLFRTLKKERGADYALGQGPGTPVVVERADSMGSKMSELTTNKVVMGVLILLVVLPFLTSIESNRSPEYELQLISAHAGTDNSSRLLFQKRYQGTLLQLKIASRDILPVDQARIDSLRAGLERRWTCGSDANREDVCALFDTGASSRHTAALGFVTTLFVVALFGAGSVVLGMDAKRFAERINTPLHKLQEDMRDVAVAKYNEYDHEYSSIREVRKIQDSFLHMKGGLKSFAKYVPEGVVKRIVTRGEEAVVNVEHREMSFFFCDIQGFTTICEKMQPDQLLVFLSEFFDEMAQIIEATGGTLIEYIGDAILAVWNAPEDVPHHKLKCLLAGWRMRERLNELSPKWTGMGYPPIYLRTGMHSGDGYIGYIGAEERLKYGVIGEHVGVASTLEEINKNYGTFTLVSESLHSYPELHDLFVFRCVDVIKVVNVGDAIKLYEVLGIRPDISPNEMPAMKLGNVVSAPLLKYAAMHDGAMEAFLRRDFQGCMDMLEVQRGDMQGVYTPGGDNPPDVDNALEHLWGRAAHYLAHPPDASWKGASNRAPGH